MKKIIKNVLPYGLVKFLQRDNKAVYSFNQQFKKYAAQLADKRFDCDWKDRNPRLDEATSTTGYDAHYVYHTAWATRIIVKSNPRKHIDISSSIDFVSLLSAMVPVEFYDYRPANIKLSGLTCLKGDVTSLPFADNSINSLSCMHVVEHVGLGRYGDAIDPHGDIKAMHELSRVLAPGGHLLFVVPVGGRAHIQFNAHRIYTRKMVEEVFSELSLLDFSIVTDSGEYIEKADVCIANAQTYGCGCFLFQKKMS
jgi:SAM-dependent methyltransferase